MGVIGIRKEDKSEFERRAPLDPSTLAEAAAGLGIEFLVETSNVRAFPDHEYARTGVKVVKDLRAADVILGIKEVPLKKLLPDKTYVFFSHTIKAQKHNMPMLKRLMDLKCTLIDYERIVDSRGKRLVFFGFHAGLAGMIDSLWAVGHRLALEGHSTPFSALKPAFHYEDLSHAKQEIGKAGEAIKRGGLPAPLLPFVVGLSGSGNVSKGAQDVLDRLPVTEVAPADLPALFAGPKAQRSVYKVVFDEPDLVRRADHGAFNLQDYYAHPEEYVSTFDRHLPFLSAFVNGIYWTPKYPRLVTRRTIADLAKTGALRLRVIADISCDIDGSIELTTQATTQKTPLLAFDPATGTTQLSNDAPGIAVLAVDNLPCELPVDSTRHFGASLKPFLVALATLDRRVPFDAVAIPPELRPAVIVWNGELTPEYQYLEKHL